MTHTPSVPARPSSHTCAGVVVLLMLPIILFAGYFIMRGTAPKTIVKTVTITTPGPTVVSTQTKTVQVPTLPESCRTLLEYVGKQTDLTDTFIKSYGPMPDQLNSAFNAIATGDIDALNQARLDFQAYDATIRDTINELIATVQTVAQYRTQCDQDTSR